MQPSSRRHEAFSRPADLLQGATLRLAAHTLTERVHVLNPGQLLVLRLVCVDEARHTRSIFSDPLLPEVLLASSRGLSSCGEVGRIHSFRTLAQAIFLLRS